MSNIYLGTIDAGGDGKTLLLAAINKKLNKNYQMEDFDFSDPSMVQVVQPTHNSKIFFGPKLSAGYYGVRTVFYNRIHASELGRPIVAYDGELMVSQVLDKINEKLGILITAEDIIDKPITPPVAGEPVIVDLEFVPGSIIFYSSTFVQVGQNDPTGDTKPVLPFQDSATLMFDNTTAFSLNGVATRMLEPYSLSVGLDNERKRTASLTSAMQGTKSASHARVRMSEATYQATKKHLPLVGHWRHPISGKSRGISVIGDIYELSEDGYDWSLIGNGWGLETGDPKLATDAYASPNVKVAVQGVSGAVFVLARKPGDTPGIWRIDPVDNTWTKLNYNSTRMQCLTPALWDQVDVKDIVHVNQRLWVLIRSTTQYDIHPQKSRNTPSVEMYNTNTLATDYFPLGDTKMRFSDIEMDTVNGKWALVTPMADSTYVDVVALLPSKTNNNTYAVQYRYQPTGEYLGYLLPHSWIPNNAAVREELAICGYQVPLKKIPGRVGSTPVTGHYLDVVQIISPINAAALNPYFLRTNMRSATQYLSYGMKTLTCISTRAARTPWVETDSSLQGSLPPVFVALHGKEGRNHVIFQNGKAMHRTVFRQSLTAATFEAVLDSQAKLDSHTGFQNVSRCGSGIYVPPGVSELDTITADLATIQDDEAALPPIGFSFIARNGTDIPAWYTAQTASELLTLRKPSANYAFMGPCPGLVAAEGTRILYLSREGNGIFQSTNNGASWQEFNATPAFYRQERAASVNENIIGTANMVLRTTNFGEGALQGDTFLLNVLSNELYNLYDVNAGNNNAPKTIVDQQLYIVKPGTSGNAYIEANEQAGFGMNILSKFSPRKVLAWDSDRLGNFETIGNYTTNPLQSYANEWRITDYMYQTPGALVDFSRDIKYLDQRHFILTQDNNIWSLGFTKGVIPTKKYGLYGTVGGEFPNFLPVVNFHLWEFLDEAASYVPYVFYGNGMVLLLERLDTNNEFAATQHLISIPNDNGQPLTPVKMYTANRRDYWFAQKGNGIFKLNYTWDGINRISKVTLVRVFNLNTPQLNMLEVTSGCITGVTARQAPMEALIPDELPADYFIGQHCRGTTLVKRYADGAGSFYETEEANSVECGYVIPINIMPNTVVTDGSSS